MAYCNTNRCTKCFVVLILLLVGSLWPARSQTLSLKTNALYWATTTPNVAVEYAVAPRWTLVLEAGYNPWTFDVQRNIKAKHLLVSPQARYWFCESYLGHFVGAQAIYTRFNVSGIFQDSRNEGWAVAVGANYGYAWPISRCWSVEAQVGLGVWYTQYNSFESVPCGIFNERVHRFVPGLTSLGVSFIYLIK